MRNNTAKSEIVHPIKVGLISLGCAKNLVDSEIILGNLLQNGIEITNDTDSADAIIINTCSFIGEAKEESVDTILESAFLRERKHPDQCIIVAGCLPQLYKDKLPKLLPEVDAFMGVDQLNDAPQIIRTALTLRRQRSGTHSKNITNSITISKKLEQNSPILNVTPRSTYIPDYTTPRFRLTPPHFAYIKIAEGCNHPCSFCIIPRIRGPYRSRPVDDIVAEAKSLIAEGVKEINLISQDTTYYGVDFTRKKNPPSTTAEDITQKFGNAIEPQTLPLLLRKLNELDGDFWIRLLYTHPAHWTDELIETIASCRKIARYIDMPLQHIHPVMLERMRRETTQENIVKLLQKIRSKIPGITIRTTFIVGFPGETERCFKTLLNFVKETKFERLGVFTYSKEEGTRAALMSDQVPEQTKKRRRRILMEEQRKIAREISESYIGKTIKVLVERRADSRDFENTSPFSAEFGQVRKTVSEPDFVNKTNILFVARSEADAPDIDGRVYIAGETPIGKFIEVKVIDASDYDLLAEPVKQEK